MDPQSQILRCKICNKIFDDESRCPRILQCGHSFCHSCLGNAIVSGAVCPTCNMDIDFPSVHAIPVNFFVKDILSEIQSSSNNYKESPNTFTPSAKKMKSGEGFCEEHQYSKELRCMDCAVWLCGMCASLYHKEHRTLLVATALDEMKKKYSKLVENDLRCCKYKNVYVEKEINVLEQQQSKLKQELKVCESAIETLQGEKMKAEMAYKKLEHLEESVMEASHHEVLKQTLKMMQTFREESRDILTLTIQTLQCWLKKEPIYVMIYEAEVTKYGRVDIQNDEVLIYCFQTQLPDEPRRIIPFEHIIHSFEGDPQLPHTRRGFLQFRDLEDNSTFEIVVKTSDLSSRALNFLLLCSGIRGQSYKDCVLESYGWAYAFCSSPSPPLPVVDDVEWKSFDTMLLKGVLWGMDGDSSGFEIFMEDQPSQTHPNFIGTVEKGLQHLELRIEGHQLEIIDSGLVF